MATGPGHLLAGRYRLRALLGQGGMGIVWRAYDDLLGRDVAVKEVLWPPELTASEQQVQFRRTVREARAAARLNHPAAVTVFDVVEEDGRPWIVMEFVRSRSLAQAVEEDGPLPPPEVARIGLQVLAALTAAHAAGILHRDVKPGNVLLAEDGRVVLTDFGIAALHGDATLTASGAVIGSAAYIAPERARGGSAEPASDLWSLGVTLYAAVEGRTPHQRHGAVPTLLAVATEEPDPPQRAGPLAPVLEGLLRRDPASRLTAADAGRLLRAVGAGSGEATQPAAPQPASRPDLANGAPTRTLGLPGQPSTVLAAVPPATSRRPVPGAAGPDDPGRTPRRRYLVPLIALGGLVIVGLAAALLLLPGHTSGRHHPPAASPGSASSATSAGAASHASAGPSVTPPGSAAATSGASAGPSAAPSGAASTGGGSPQPTAAGADPSP
jgi:hypothetical protein